MTRTFFFGKPENEMIEVYNTVLEAQKKGIDSISAGKNGKDIDAAARKIIDSSKFKGRFIHSLGHGIGLEVHDHPALNSSTDFFLKENMAITVEPGIYIPKKGGVRIEDDVIVTSNGCQVITTAPKELLIV
ncbi:MAG: M24 family metallopeptidase, partial [Thermoplasmatales archaeon]